MRIHTFSVKKSKDATESHEFSVKMPTDLSEVELIEARYGSQERALELAEKAWTVDCQRGVRERLPDLEAAEMHVETFCDDGRKGATTPVVRVPDVGLTDTQKDAIRDSNPSATVIFFDPEA